MWKNKSSGIEELSHIAGVSRRVSLWENEENLLFQKMQHRETLERQAQQPQWLQLLKEWWKLPLFMLAVVSAVLGFSYWAGNKAIGMYKSGVFLSV